MNAGLPQGLTPLANDFHPLRGLESGMLPNQRTPGRFDVMF